MSEACVLASTPVEGVRLVRINRPEKLNALNGEVMAGLGAVFAAADGDDGVRVVVLTGEGRAFSAGADIAAMADGRGLAAYEAAERRAAWSQIERFPKPLIAAVHGVCIGGGLELALLADIVIAAPEARFGLGETRLGLMPGDGGTQRVPRLIGPQRAARTS
jgi:enoyl-CoA hydratase